VIPEVAVGRVTLHGRRQAIMEWVTEVRPALKALGVKVISGKSGYAIAGGAPWPSAQGDRAGGSHEERLPKLGSPHPCSALVSFLLPEGKKQQASHGGDTSAAGLGDS